MDATIVAASLDNKELENSINQLVKNFDAKLAQMMKDTDVAVSTIENTFKRLRNVDFGGTSKGGSISKETKQQERETQAVKESVQAHKEETLTLDQERNAINAATQSQKTYTEEVLRRAAAIRATKEWQERGNVIIGDKNYYDPERENTTKRGKEILLSLEEQILQEEQKRVETEQKITLEAQRQAELAAKPRLGEGGVAWDMGLLEQQENSRRWLRAQTEKKEVLEKMEKDYTSLEKTVAKYTGLSLQEISITTEKGSSYNMLSNSLKHMTSAYNEMTEAERRSEGEGLARSIRETRRETQKLQTQLSRPANLREALGHPEKTLDDITYKIQQLRLYMQGLDKMSPEMNQVKSNIKRLQAEYDNYMGKAHGATQINAALVRSFNYMKNRLAFYFTVGASVRFVNNLIEVRSQYEMNERALGILIDSAERGTKIFKELSDMALVSPYTLIELSSAAKQLTAYDIAAKDVVDTTRRLADMAAAVGIPIERLTYALGQIKAYGYLNSRDNRMFANAGIPLVRQLADYYTELEGRMVSTADVYDRIKKKAVDYNDVMQVINKMTDEGGRFFDFQAKMAETLKVQIANLTLAWNNMLNDMGKESQGMISGSIGLLKELFLRWKEIDKLLRTVAVTVGIYKGSLLALDLIIGKNTRSLVSQTAAMEGATAADYMKALSSQKLSKSQASVVLALNRTNVALKEAVVSMKLLTEAEATAIVKANFLKAAGIGLWNSIKVVGAGIKSLAISLKNLFVSNWIAIAIMVATDAIMHYVSEANRMKEVNEELARSAKDAAKSIAEVMKDDNLLKVVNTAALHPENINQSDATKAWERIREEIEKSALSGERIVEQLLQEDNIVQRVVKGFEELRRLRESQEKLSGIGNDLRINQDSWLWGAFGEGLGTDVEDYTEHWLKNRKEILETYKEEKDRINELNRAATTGHEFREMNKEIQALADNIADILRARNIVNPTEVQEAVERIRQIVKENSPQIKGEVETMFDFNLDRILSQTIKGFEGSSSAIKKIIEQLRRDSSHVFQDITDKTENLSQKQKDAIQAAIDKLRNELPPNFGNVLDTLQSDLQSRDWVIRIRTAFASPEPSWLESDLKKRLPLTTVSASTEENLTAFLDKQRKDRKAALDEMADMRKAGLENTQHYFDVEKTAKEATEVLKAYNSELEKTTKKSKGNQKDEVLDALKQEIDLVKKLQGEYDKLVKSGAAIPDALEAVGNAFGNTIKFLNAKLQGFNIPQIDLKKVLTGDPNKTLAYFESLKRDLESKGLLNLERSKALEAVIEEVKVKAKTFNLDMITKSLNNELGRLKDEYELAIALDADPEMGGIFADMFDIHLENLPRTAEQYAKGLTESLNKYLKSMGSDLNISDILGLTKDNLKAFEEQVKNSQFNQAWLDKIREVYKAAHDVREKEAKETIKGWQNLLKEYGEYEAKIAEIQKKTAQARVVFVRNFGNADQKAQAIGLNTRIAASTDPDERARLINQLKELVDSLAGDDELRLKIKTSIDEFDLQSQARVAFEEFQKSPQWITATGDLAGMSDKAIESLIKDIENYKKSARNLSPKQIKEINRALKSLYKQQREGNPFKFMSNIMDEAKSRMENYDEAIADTEKKIEGLIQKRKKQGGLSDEETKQLNGLIAKNKELHKSQEEAGEINAKDVVAGLQNIFEWASQCVKMFSDMADALMGEKWSEAKENLNDVMSTMQSGLQGAQMGAAVGGGYGAIIGGAAGLIMGAITAFSDNADKRILAKIEESERAVKKLDNEVEALKGDYDAVTFAADRSYGAQKKGAELTASSIKEAEKAAKRLQLVELNRQLQLEKSRDSKKRDEDKIVSLEKEIISMENEIRSMERELKTAVADIVDDLLGLSRGSWAEELTDALITAFKTGEDYMDVFSESWEEMVQNMVVKTIAAKVIGDALEKNVLSRIEEIENQETAYYRQQSAELETQMSNLRQLRLDNPSAWLTTLMNSPEWNKINEEMTTRFGQGWVDAIQAIEKGGFLDKDWWNRSVVEGFGDSIQEVLSGIYGSMETNLQANLNQAQQEAQEQALKEVLTGEEGKKTKAALEGSVSLLGDILKEYGVVFGDTKNTLSALQQGISSITETQAEALEGYMNIVSQRIFYHGTIMEQIRDAVQSFNFDVQLSVQSQMLLQLQNNYIIMQSMQSMMESWTVPSGQGIRVELMS